MESNDLPYRAEYAKSGRAACKKCKDTIAKDSLRLALMVQSPFFDGKQPNWHHFTCFFGRARPKATTEIAHFESLRWDDQEKIRKRIDGISGGAAAAEPEPTKKGKKRAANGTATATAVPADINDYIVEYAKSSKSKCKVCEENIPKQELRISKKDFESEAAMQWGPTERWHHVKCFVRAREELGFTVSATLLPGFMALNPEDQKLLKTELPAIQSKAGSDLPDGVSSAKKPKEVKGETKDVMKAQNDNMFFFRDNLQKLHKTELASLLEYNKQQVPDKGGESAMLDRLSDIMTFGALTKCTKCKTGQFVFRSGFGYQCIGHLSEWSKCENFEDRPKRVPFKVPKEFKEQYPFLKKAEKKTGDRLFTKATVATATSSSSSSGTNGSHVEKKQVPVLTSLTFMLHKTKNKKPEEVKKQIAALGGKVVACNLKIDKNTVAVISNEDEITKNKPLKAINVAKELDIYVVTEDFFDLLQPTSSREELIKLLDEKKISDWGSKASSKIPTLDTIDSVSKSVYPSKSIYPDKSLFKSDKSVAKVTLKGGLAVDPDSLLDHIAHVYRKGDDVYSVVLSVTDVSTNKNSFYKLQVLEADKKNKYWLFRAWGRIGTTIGGTKTEEHSTLQNCIDIFKQLFEERTANMWDDRKNFKKVPGKYMIVDVNYGDDEKLPRAMTEADGATSKLAKPVQDLITLIFDIEKMKKAMLEFELDLNKMPLGKLSQKQLQRAFGVLNDLQNLINNNSENALIVDKTNQFYTFVPHDFGIATPKILNTEQDIKDKITMLNDLMDIEIAYKLLQECNDSTGNPIDAHYEKLNTTISVLDRDSDEFKFIELYTKNTHAKTHSGYTLDIEQVFKVERKGEAAKYKKFAKLENKKLLWHGSRLTNFAGILSQGLRIAPPEAPVTGYMFGKGIYFADMVSKSANYCATSRSNNTGLLLLCEVALGKMKEYTQSHYVEKLPNGVHSVKGVGTTEPDPTEIVKTESGVEIPLGKGVPSKVKHSSLLYNEYIVYDVNQVKIEYLLRVKFNHK